MLFALGGGAFHRQHVGEKIKPEQQICERETAQHSTAQLSKAQNNMRWLSASSADSSPSLLQVRCVIRYRCDFAVISLGTQPTRRVAQGQLPG